MRNLFISYFLRVRLVGIVFAQGTGQAMLQQASWASLVVFELRAHYWFPDDQPHLFSIALEDCAGHQRPDEWIFNT